MSFFRNLLNWRPGAAKALATAAPAPIPEPAAASIPGTPISRLASPSPAPSSSPPEPPATKPSPEDCIPIPLKAITDLFPPELRPALRKQPSEHVDANIPRAIIQPQLAAGAVRISFGQLRASAPEIFFHADAAPADAKLLLPLESVLRQMMPCRRDDQRQPAIPVNIPSIFAKAASTSARPGSPASRGGAEPWFSQRRPTIEPQGGAPQAEQIRNSKSEIRKGPNTNGGSANGGAQNRTPQPAQPPQPAPAAAIPKIPAAPIIPAAPVIPATPAPPAAIVPPIIPAPAPPLRIPVPVPAPASVPADSVAIPLASVLPALPPEVRQALGGATSAHRSFVIPMAEIETRMRTGKLEFKWSQLRGWCGGQGPASLADDLDVELPLATVVPLFLSVRQAPDTRKKVEVDSRIPDVFGKSAAPVPSPAPAPTPAAAPSPAATPAPAPVERPLRLEQTPEPQPTPPQPAANGAEPASVIPGGKSANQEIGVPGEIIRRIRALDGVSGAFLATGDGLLIAGDVPGTNDNILAAFAPTVFSQMGKYAEMARLGVPAAIELHLTGANVHVRKAGKLFLGVLMPPGCPLPLSEIDSISATLQPHAS